MDKGASALQTGPSQVEPVPVSPLRASVPSAVPREQWYWCGYPGHFIAAASCRYHLHTRIAGVIVSTVGDYWPHREKGRQSIGCGRDFETNVFLALDSDRPEGEPLDYSEIDSLSSNDSEESERQHHAMCEKWASLELQAQAIEARRAETQGGSVHESAVGNADAPETPQVQP